MIDTDKYDGHSTDYTYEIVVVDDEKELFATYALLNDAPLLLAEVKRLREALRIERRIVQAFYDYRDARCYEDCEAWMLEKGHRVMVKYGNEEQSEWKVEVE